MPNWTEEQKQAIDLRNRNILVSAAAGSGKTAVLVQRIIEIVSNDNIDIDTLLVVTFTNAAAAEMRERIIQAIEDRLLKDLNNTHLQKQQTLIHNAQITTIHSFCLNIIRNNFNVIDLDPAFRIADEVELKLLKADTISDLLEQHYSQEDDNFFDFVETYSTGKKDNVIEDLILQLYTFSQSYPSPHEWLNSLRDLFNIQTEADLQKTKWLKFLLNYIRELVSELENTVNEALAICNEEDGPYMYANALEEDRLLVQKLNAAKTYTDYSNILADLSWTKLTNKKDINVSSEKRESTKFLRDKIKSIINNLKKSYFFQPLEMMIEDIKNSKAVMNELIDLTIEFTDLYSKNKLSKNILDFNDLEHKALDILTTKVGEEYIQTDIAKDLSNYYKEIIIDEYQDSNLVQETILNSISKENQGNPNKFMVGDVKQSIYKFRLARPEMFVQKLNTYSKEIKLDSKYQCIDLHKNFRSRAEVLDSINFIFNQIMIEKLADIEYNDETALYLGASFPPSKSSNNTELMLLDISQDDVDEIEKRESEAKMIAQRIKELINSKFQVYDKEYRNIKYSDIVILLRTVNDWADIFENVLMNEGIPAHSDISAGYFSTIEVQTILSILDIIDNPIQDIPITAVLKSPIFSLTSEQLAIVKSEFREDMYTCITKYIESDLNSDFKFKLIEFKNMLDDFRSHVPYTNIHELIQYILDKTGYYNYILAMPSGNRRAANIDMLIEKAIQYEKTNYKDLFSFLRYIYKLKQYQIDFGETNILGENENVVRIMSIHKSKGLEFPVVFVSGLGKQFNTQDSKSRIVLHPDFGIGNDYIDCIYRTKSATLIKKVISKKIVLESLSEELRILYVALSRAKEKLILTGALKNRDKYMSDISEMVRSYPYEKLSFTLISSAKSYLDWILPALMRHTAFDDILKNSYIYVNKVKSKYMNTNFEPKIIDISDLIEQETKSKLDKQNIKNELINWKPNIFDSQIHNEIENKLNWKYQYSNEVNLYAKLTVTELKTQNLKDEQSQNLIEYKPALEFEPTLPNFMTDRAVGAVKGTIIHKVMQNINLSDINSISDVKNIVDYLVKIQKITNEDKIAINFNEIYNLVKSPLGKRMIKAEQNNKLFKERPFLIGLKANEIDTNFKSDELVLIQGTIDAYFEEDNNYILVDYKTDRASNPETLIENYKLQLDYYQRAIEQITKCKVKQKIIYSFELNQQIEV